MNTFEFFNENFGRHLVEQDGAPYQAAARALSSSHKMLKGTSSRLASGWAIVKPGNATIQLKLAYPSLSYDVRTRFEAMLEALENWDGQPTLFLTFDKSPLSISNIFLTVDLRAVRICMPSGVQTFNYMLDASETSPQFYKILAKMRNRNAR